MKRWSETRRVLAHLEIISRTGTPAALATVVRVVGSAYRREGAKLLVCADGSMTGNVSGGCLEQDVIEVARRVLQSGASELRTYCSSHDQVAAWDLGLGCEGQVEVYVEPVRTALSLARDMMAGSHPAAFVLCTLLHGGTLTVSSTACDGDLGAGDLNRAVLARARALLGQDYAGLEVCGDRSVFFDALEPAPELIVCGAGEDVPALVRLAASVGFRIAVLDRRRGRLDAARFPEADRLIHADGEQLLRVIDPTRSYAVVMTHNFADDAAYLGALLSTSVPYIGVLGPRERTDRLLETVRPNRVPARDDARLYAPVGLDIGTDGAEQVALSIVSEILAVRSGRPVQSLRERAFAAIHA